LPQEAGPKNFQFLCLWQFFLIVNCYLLLITFFTPPCAQAQNYSRESAAYQACTRAETFINAHQWQEANKALNQAAGYDPTSNSAYIHQQLSYLFEEQKQYKAAIEELKKAAIYKANEELEYNIATINYNAGNYQAALSGLENYIVHTKNQKTKQAAMSFLKEVGAYGNLKIAYALIDKGKLKAAKTPLLKAATYDPSPYSDSIHSNLAYVFRTTGCPEQAIPEAQKAIKLAPQEANTYYLLGLAYQDIGDFDQAIVWLNRYAQKESKLQERQQALDFAQELALDKNKRKNTGNQKNYFDQQQESGYLAIWPAKKMPLKIYIEPAKNVYGYKTYFNNYITNAFDTWCSSCPKISYKYVSQRNDADITLEWTSEPVTLEESGKRRQKAGITNTSTTNDQINSAQIRVRTLNAFANNAIVEDGECACTVMHEAGHSLGLGHSPSVYDLMYFGSSSKQSGTPTARDKATLACLYKNLPPVINPIKAAKPLPIEYLPPPAFLPPRPANTQDLMPPIFLPPPLKKDLQLLKPPVFLPPALPLNKNAQNKTGEKPVAQPFFTPPPK
jgi:tetratricopeptide (TPR) repeat protein